jgi:hypothetical protein
LVQGGTFRGQSTESARQILGLPAHQVWPPPPAGRARTPDPIVLGEAGAHEGQTALGHLGVELLEPEILG